jgi:hypothetical protein
VTGPEHYREAEALLEESSDPSDHGVSALHAHIARAQVHATLALTAATIDAAEAANEGLANRTEWIRAQS